MTFFNAVKFIPMVIVKEIVFICVMYAVTVCETDWKKSLAIRTDWYLVYTNENEGGRWDYSFVDELIGSDH